MRSTVADIELDAVSDNVRSLALASRASVIAVVKADGYGHGAEAVGRAALDAGAVMLAVFTVEEGIVLRRAEPEASILVLGGATDDADLTAALTARLSLVEWDERRAGRIASAARAQRTTATLHFKVDTGLTRLGARLEDAARAGLQAAAHLADRVPLRPALTWRSVVRRVADVPVGAGVSYGHVFRASRESRIATVPVGYGDGLLRSGSGRLWVLVGGQPAPVAGRIAMDLVMLDVTGRETKEGDEVVIIGEQRGARQTAEDVAEACGTVSYEIVGAIRPRVPKRYLRDGRLVATKTLAEGFRWC
ncbi:MAG: alanine racemase [Chloroflexi bacterium]|nr:alanine racemase [Chloroflexota bacterium]